MDKKHLKTDIITIIVLIGIVVFTIIWDRKLGAVNQQAVGFYDFEQTTVGVITTSTGEEYAQAHLKKAHIQSYPTLANLIFALESGRVDVAIMDDNVAEDYNKGRDNLIAYREALVESHTAAIFEQNSSNRKLVDQFNGYLARLKESGELEKMIDKWERRNKEGLEYDEVYDFEDLPDINGTIKFAISIEAPPYIYLYESLPTGLEIELAYKFFKECGYAADVYRVEIDGILYGLKTGRYNMALGGLTISEERKESLTFSDPICELATHAYILNGSRGSSLGFLGRLNSIFYNSFVHAERYKLFIQGFLTTIYIALMSAILGSILAILICRYRLTNSEIGNKLCDIFVAGIEGIPTLILLMFLYFVVFNKSNWRGEEIAILAFSLNFAAHFSEIIMVAMKSIDYGQYEAGISSGFARWKVFSIFIIPQSLAIILPVLKGELITLVKDTSIVGYIAIGDMTRMGDIIRGRTFEPFLLLLVISLIYYILTLIINKIIDYKLDKIKWIKEE